VERFADRPDDELQVRRQQTIRNYDSCGRPGYDVS